MTSSTQIHMQAPILCSLDANMMGNEIKLGFYDGTVVTMTVDFNHGRNIEAVQKMLALLAPKEPGVSA
jgi:hypothetical protein